MITNFKPLDASKTEREAKQFIQSNVKSTIQKFEYHIGFCECGETRSLVAFDNQLNKISFRLICDVCGDEN